MKNKTCGECKHFEVDTVSAVCEKKRWICDDDAPACNRFEQKQTLFDQITQSPETLAEKLVFWMSWHKADGAVEWYAVSTVAEGKWSTKKEAIAATVAKLKDVCR
jgi:hypothetical protein